MKDTRLNQPDRPRRAPRPGLPALLATLGLLAIAHPARAQFPVSLGQQATVRHKGPAGVETKQALAYVRPSYISFSPLTLFQIKNAFLNSAGQRQDNKRSDLGPFLQYEKHSPLRSNVAGQDSYAALGAWYWYHGKKADYDRFALYAQYYYTPQFGVSLNLGGSTQGQAASANSGQVPSGLFEYYGFLLYSPSLGSKSKLGVQLGVGPYIVRSSVGNAGYTYTVGGVYTLTDTLSLSASGWFVNYKAKPGSGLNNTSNNLLRSQIAVVYNFK